MLKRIDIDGGTYLVHGLLVMKSLIDYDKKTKIKTVVKF